MIQFGAAISGAALHALVTWMPVWRLSNAESAEAIFRYFVVIGALLFGVFMVSGSKNGFRPLLFFPPLLGGALVSYGYAHSSHVLMGCGAAVAIWSWIALGE